MTTYSFDEEGVTFYFFIMTLVGFYVIPTTVRLVWPKKVSENDREPVSSAKESVDKKARLLKLAKARQSTQLPKMVVLAAAWVVFAWALYSAWQAKINFKPYDPFEILGISTSATEEEVKNTFKKLSRLHHPDKSPADKRETAEKKFVEISKAYKALTDEKIRKNWEEYGNPDGIRTFALGVALPSWLVNSSNRVILLVLYCVVFGVGLPLIVKRWWSSSKEFTKDGLRHSSMAMFFRELRENSSMRKILDMISNASEFSIDIPKRSTDEAALNALLKALEEYRDPLGDNYERPKKASPISAVKAHALLYCHLHRVDFNNADLRQDQAFIVAKATQLAQGLLQIALARNWLLPTLHCMNISQYLVQATYEGRSPLLQIPHITNDIVKHATSGRRSIKSIADLLDMTESERRNFLRTLSEEQYRETLRVAETFPIIKVDAVTFRILGQEHITPGGLITCQVLLSLEYPSLEDATTAEVDEGGKGRATLPSEDDVQTFEFDEDGNLIDDPGKKVVGQEINPRPTYCPHFATVKRPYWWVGLMNRNNTNLITTPVKVTDLVDRKTVILQLPAPPKPMNVTIKLFVKSDAIVGADIEKEVSFTVHHHSSENSPSEHWDISGDDDDQAVPFASDNDSDASTE